MVLWLSGLWVASGIAASEPKSTPPNILLIISDDQAWTDYGFMGHPQVRTPRLDRLAAESLCFRRGYVPSSLCCPSLASIITGLYPHQHRIVGNDPPRLPGQGAADFYRSEAFRRGRDRLVQFLEEVPTLPRLLQQRGYRSFQSGKWWLEHFSTGGFTDGMTAGDPGQGGRHGDRGLAIGRETLEPIYDFMDQAERDRRPWFVWYAPMMPHDPHTPPERFLSRYRGATNSLPVARYWGMVEWFDETCGELLDALERRGTAKDTLVVYVTDNGWITDPTTGRFAPRSKQSPYDGGLRTPILVRWPGRVAARVDDTPVSSLDLLPTILRAAGVSVPESLPGVDLGDRRAVRNRRAIFGECFTHDIVDLDRPARSLRWRWILSGDWKLIMPAEWNEPVGRPELYRVDEDPNESRDLAVTQPRRVRRMLRQLDNWWAPTLNGEATRSGGRRSDRDSRP